MKLSKAELVKLLSEHLGSDEDAVSSQLDKLVADIQKSTSKGDPFVIQGFGVFSLSGEGLTFEVSPAFAAEINYTYEGMLPIDVDGASSPFADTESETPKKPTVKKPVVIVDEGVDGEEDPFGLPEEESEDVEFVDPIAFLDDLEGKSEDAGQDSGDSVFGDQIDEDFAESENEPYGAIGSIDDSVDEEEKQLLETGISLVNDTDEATDDVSTDDESAKSEDPFQAVIDAEPHEVERIEEPESEEEGTQTLKDEELILDEPPKEIADSSSSVLDEFFDPAPEPEQKLEGVIHDSNDEVESLLNDGEEPIQDENGPRIVSIEEDEKDYSISFLSIIKWVAIIVVVVLTAGGAYWYFTGPGRSLFGSSNSTSAQAVVTQPVITETTSPIDENSIAEEDSQAGIVEDSTGSAVIEGSDIDTDSTPNTVEESAVSESIESDPGITDSSQEVSNETEPNDENQTQNATESIASPSSYGLTGQSQPIGGKVYSIIIHSLPSQVSAQEQCNEISSMNLRCLVREATGPQGRTTYRVGVGQFDSVESAEAAISQLPEPYRSRNFVARVN